MKKFGIVVFLLIVFILIYSQMNRSAFGQNALQQSIPLNAYNGKWYINKSTFPMWLKGDKTNPTFNYSIETKDSISGLHGDVQYFKKGKQKSIEGFDQPTNEYNTAFLWRGKGFLKLFKSRWEIIAFDAEQHWAIMHFEKTLFTPEGYDLFSRQKQLDEATMVSVRKKLVELGIDGKLAAIRQE